MGGVAEIDPRMILPPPEGPVEVIRGFAFDAMDVARSSFSELRSRIGERIGRIGDGLGTVATHAISLSELLSGTQGAQTREERLAQDDRPQIRPRDNERANGDRERSGDGWKNKHRQ